MSEEKYNDKELTRIFKDIILSLEKDFKRIEKLEKDNKRLEEHRILGNKTLTKYLNKKAKEISELRSKLKKWGLE